MKLFYVIKDYVHDQEVRDITSSKTVLKQLAEEYYHEHFVDDDDYEPKFKIKSFLDTIEFWDLNGYDVLLYAAETEEQASNNFEYRQGRD